MVVFDANFLIYFLDPHLKDGAGKNPRVDHLVAEIDKNRERIIVPTPALAELLVGAGDAASAYLDAISRSRFFRVEPFGERAAIEAAALTREAIKRGDKLSPAVASGWQKVKFDRQIVAIAKVAGASVIYSQDGDLAKHAKEVGIETLTVDMLPDPPVLPQFEMPLSQPEQDSEVEVD